MPLNTPLLPTFDCEFRGHPHKKWMKSHKCRGYLIAKKLNVKNMQTEFIKCMEEAINTKTEDKLLQTTRKT